MKLNKDEKDREVKEGCLSNQRRALQFWGKNGISLEEISSANPKYLREVDEEIPLK